MTKETKTAPRRIGRYLLFDPIASGGMATVHYGLMTADAGFTRMVAIKRVRADKRNRRGSEESLLDEARLASRVQHPNVVPPLDVFWHDKELLVVLEYVAGESLSRLLRATDERDERIPVAVGATVVVQVLHGLHAAHDAKSTRGKPLGIVHRDVSPQNILIGRDGLARVLDFGIAKATERLTTSMAGQIKGKLAYMAPEQLQGRADRRTDIYATAVVFWEILAGRRLFHANNSKELFAKVLQRDIHPPSHFANVPPALDALVMRGLEREPEDRFETARHFALAIEEAAGVASSAQIGDWVEQVAGGSLAERAAMVAQLEREVTNDDAATPGQRTASEAEAAAASDAISTPTRGAWPRVPSDEASTVPRPGAADETEVESEDDLAPRTSPPSEDTESVTLVAAGQTARSPQTEEATMPAVTIPGGSVHAASVSTSPSTPSPAAPETRGGAARWLVMLAFVAVGGIAAWFLAPRPPPQRPATSPQAENENENENEHEHDLENGNGNENENENENDLEKENENENEHEHEHENDLEKENEPPQPSATASSAPPSPSSFAPPMPSPPPRVAPRPPPKRDCSPPYTVDDRGIRHLKPQCL